MTSPSAPDIHIHYLGHASFILFFDDGLSLLTDYGESCAYGLDSPIYEFGTLQPDIVTYSHHHADHDRGSTFTGARVVDGADLKLKDITFTAIPVTEKSEGDNFSYLITYKGLTIYHAGDSQGDIVQIQEADIRQRVKNQLPDKIDLLLIPVGWIRDITEQAVAYVDFLQPRRLIPMHYWSENEKHVFLTKLKEIDKIYDIHEIGGPTYTLPISRPPKKIEVVSLTPASYKS